MLCCIYPFLLYKLQQIALSLICFLGFQILGIFKQYVLIFFRVCLNTAGYREIKIVKKIILSPAHRVA